MKETYQNKSENIWINIYIFIEMCMENWLKIGDMS